LNTAPDHTSRAPVLVLGLGNILLQDEGLGVHALKRLSERYQLSPGVELMDGGTSGMALIDAMAGREQLLVVDAVEADGEPGTLVELANEEVPAYLRTLVSPHEIGLVDVLGVMTLSGEAPAEIHLVGMVPSSTELDLELTSPIADRIDALVDRVVTKLRAWGYDVTPRSQPGIPCHNKRTIPL